MEVTVPPMPGERSASERGEHVCMSMLSASEYLAPGVAPNPVLLPVHQQQNLKPQEQLC